MDLCSSFESFRKILEQQRSLEKRLPDHSKYYAHTHTEKRPETLPEHVNLVIDYAFDLMETHGIERVVNRLIEPLSVKEYVNDPVAFGNFVKRLFLNTILFHDYGKINENFQRERMANDRFQINTENGIDSQHSILSAFLYVAEHIYEMHTSGQFDKMTQAALYALTFWLSNTILKHHASHLENDLKYEREKIAPLIPYLKKIDSPVDEGFLRAAFHIDTANSDYLKKINEISRACFTKDCRFPIYALLKLNFSLLTAADYYATSEYMNDLKADNFGTITSKQGQELLHRFKSTKRYNKRFFEQPAYFRDYPEAKLETRSPENLNILRQKLLAEVMDSVNANRDQNIFYLEAPTGSGKTNISMAAALQLLHNHPELNKIYFVFPFTTLITQTAKSIRETLELTAEDLVALHSRSGFHSKREASQDGEYGAEKLNYLDNLFVNYPITLLSHIKFFDILKSNSKEATYLLHRLANSVVVIDELQSYPPQHWDKITFFLQNFAKYFNIKVVLMSATLPKLDRLKVSDIPATFCPLVKNKNRYFLNPNFSQRVIFDFSLLEKSQDLETLANFILEKCTQYASENNGSAKALVEFIYKKTASQFYNIIRKRAQNAGFRTLVLSGTILEPRRRRIIELIKSTGSNNQKILLISTQVIEAGVDIDMDIGFKDRSLIDSDEQLAGRVNRNARTKPAIVYIFDLDQTFRVYGDDLRYSITRDQISISEYKRIIQKKVFDELYDKVCEHINRENTDEFVRNLSDYLEKIKHLEFSKIESKFKLIQQQNVSVFIPLKIPAMCFSNADLLYIRELGHYHAGRAVDGNKVWHAYLDIIHSKKPDIIKKKIDLKRIYGIMSQFMFSIIAGSNTINELLKFCDYEYYEKYNILFLEDWREVYDYRSGILEDNFGKGAFL